ncbi:hypothetical protein MSPP1_002673 [Malassezia sp. CBS 17886]|nr:hypothetical protein MSPP1_002673 [Malassezia sp. CBS 17886]
MASPPGSGRGLGSGGSGACAAGSDTRDACALREDVSQEIDAIQCIYADGDVQVSREAPAAGSPTADGPLLAAVSVPIQQGEDAIFMRLKIVLDPGYPATDVPPQFVLLNRYIGQHRVDAPVHNFVGQLYTGDSDGAPTWSPHTPVLFEGIEAVLDYVSAWCEQRTAALPATESRQAHAATTSRSAVSAPPTALSPTGDALATLAHSDAICERKSEFLGHAARIQHPDDVAALLAHLVSSDKRIQRATHPVIHAWVCRTPDGVLHHDCDDDGETAAGGRLAHLLSLLVRGRSAMDGAHAKNVENVLVVVTRWYGGVNLGPDRFKLINRAAKEALTRSGALS